MKKILSLLAVAMLGISAVAQTNFRHVSFAEAQKAAQQEKKLVFVDFYTSWCGPCKNMANNVFPQKKVGDFMNAKFVCVKYDAEKEELDLVKRSNITAYPTFVIFNADGTELNRKVGGGSADAFIADIDRLSNAELTPEKIRSRYEAGERSATLVQAYAALLQDEASMSRRSSSEKMAQIATIINDYFDGLSDEQRLSPDNFFLYKDFCDNTSDKKMQYLFNNVKKARKAVRNDIDSIIVKSYAQDLMARAVFYQPFDADSYPLFRQQIMTIKELKAPKYEGCIEVCDAYASGDMNKYIDVVERNSQTKCKENSFTILYGLGTALDKCDKTVKTRAAKLLRSRLIDMSGNNISFIGMVIANLEGTSNRH